MASLAPVVALQIAAVPSVLAVTKVRPLGLKAAEDRRPPPGSRTVRICLWLRRLQIRAVPSSLAVSSLLPSALNTADVTGV